MTRTPTPRVKTAARKRIRIVEGSRKWNKLAADVAMSFCPALVSCDDCGYPRVTGYVCDFCNPR